MRYRNVCPVVDWMVLTTIYLTVQEKEVFVTLKSNKEKSLTR